MTGLSRCGKRYSFGGAIVAAQAREFKGAAPKEVVACGDHWHVQRKGTLAGRFDRPDPFPPAVRKQLAQRDDCCQRCGFTGRLEAHHRRAKASGGSSARAHTQCACNGVLLCRGCHSWVHLNPRKARAEGWIVLQSVSRPGTVPIITDPETSIDDPDVITEAGAFYPTCDGDWNE